METPKVKKDNVTASDHESFGTYTIIALLIPLVGFILGAILLSKDERVDRKLGEHIIVCSVFGLIFVGTLWFLWTYYLAISEVNELESISNQLY